MKALLIDPLTMKVSEVEISKRAGSHLTDIYNQIGLNCSMIEVGAYLKNSDVIYVDEEGGFEGHGVLDGRKFGFIFNGVPLWGRGLVVGSNGRGESIDALSSSESVSRCVTDWLMKPYGCKPFAMPNRE